MDKNLLIERKLGLFRTIGEAGVREAAKAFENYIQCPVSVRNLNSGLLRVSTLAEEKGDPDNAAVGIHARLDGQVSGHVAFLLPYSQALTLVDAVMRQPVGTRKKLDDLSTLALQEISRIVVSSQVSAIFGTTGIVTSCGPAVMAVDMAYKIVASIVAGTTGETESEAMVAACRFEHSDWSLDGLFLFIPDRGVTQRLLEAFEAVSAAF